MKIDANRLRLMRESRGWSQDQLAELAGVNRRTVQRLEKCGNASLETLRAIAVTLNVDISGFTASEATDRPSVEEEKVQLLGVYGPLLAALTDVLKENHHWRQHFNDLFMFRSFFFRKPDPPLFQALERQAHLASTVS